jgi:hypothetical protein
MLDEMMEPMKRWGLVAGLACVLSSLAVAAATAPGQWDQPAATLADQIADILGPAQARLVIRNLSTVSTDEIPAIRRLLEQDLKARGVQASGAESANIIRVTLSENIRERLWVAEIVEGNETRVTMVHVDPPIVSASPRNEQIVLRKETYLSANALSNGLSSSTNDSILATLETANGLIVLQPEEISFLAMTTVGWKIATSSQITPRLTQTRDPRGLLLPSPEGNNFTAYLPGTQCTGTYTPPTDNSGRYGDWTLRCHASDNPWPIAQATPATIKAFYNASRDNFTGVVTPTVGADLPAFYTAALLPRASGAVLLIDSLDGKVQFVENGTIKPVTGARDWGSDLAVLHSSCGSGAQIIASASGEALADSLRAYELPAQEAIPASVVLTMEGAVTALWTAPDGKSIFATIRKTAGPAQPDEFEVDRVTATCN